MDFRIVGENEYASVIEHLRRSFFVDEPLNVAVQLCPQGEGHEELERQCVETMKDGYSIVAIEDGEVLGVALNGVLRPGDTSKSLEKLKTLDDAKYCKIFTLLYTITESLELFEKYGVDGILECRIISVDGKARGRGLAGELMRRTIQLTKDNGYKLFKGDATGVYSQKICEKYGMVALTELRYKDYLDPGTGLPVFEVPAPHETLKIMVLRLNDN